MNGADYLRSLADRIDAGETVNIPEIEPPPPSWVSKAVTLEVEFMWNGQRLFARRALGVDSSMSIGPSDPGVEPIVKIRRLS